MSKALVLAEKPSVAKDIARVLGVTKGTVSKALNGAADVSSAMRRSAQGEVSGDGVRFSSALPYTTLHNEGGKITVTAKMKRFFWYKYKQTKDEAWKRMALMKTGKVITIPQRQFIGDGPDTQRIIREAIDRNLQKFNLSLTEFLRK